MLRDRRNDLHIEDSNADQRSGKVRRGFYLLCLLVGLTAAIVSDIRLDDETVYLARGLELVDAGNRIEASFGPLYSAYLGLLHRILQSTVASYYTNVFLLGSLFPILISRGLQVLGFKSGVSQLTGLIFGLSSVNMTGFPKVGIFTSVILIGGFILSRLIVKRRPDFASFLLGVTLLCAAYSRADMALCLVLYISYLNCGPLINRLRKNISGAHNGYAGGALLLMTLAACYLFGVPLAGGRSYDAFSDHYQVAVLNGSFVDNPFRYGKDLTATVFNGSTSVFEAFMNNPKEFAKHCLGNIGRIPGSLTDMTSIAGLRYTWIVPFVVCINGYLRHSLMGAQRRNHFANGGIIGAGLSYWLFVITTTLVSSIIIYPRDHYLALVAFPVAVFYCYGFSGLAAELRITLRKVVTAMSILMSCTIILGQLAFNVFPLRNQVIISKLRILKPGTLAASSYGLTTYLGEGWEEASIEDCTSPKTANKVAGVVDYVVLDEFMRNSRLLEKLECLYPNTKRLDLSNKKTSNIESLVEIVEFNSATQTWNVAAVIKRRELSSGVKEFLRNLVRSKRL